MRVFNVCFRFLCGSALVCVHANICRWNLVQLFSQSCVAKETRQIKVSIDSEAAAVSRDFSVA